MNESKLIHKKWKPIKTAQNLSLLQLNKILHSCANFTTLRITQNQDHTHGLELLCVDEEEFNEVEGLVHQAIADQQLRERISSKSDSEMSLIIDNIIMRALGK